MPPGVALFAGSPVFVFVFVHSSWLLSACLLAGPCSPAHCWLHQTKSVSLCFSMADNVTIADGVAMEITPGAQACKFSVYFSIEELSVFYLL